MPDGVRLAADVYLPAGPGPFPTILHQTRYYRAVGMRRGFGWVALARAMDTDFVTRQRFLAAGYAWVSVCVRGSGASFGASPFPWARAEISDGAQVLDWIVAQPWSDGAVGSTGISYAGTSAEHLAASGHRALRAIAPRFSCFDVYPDVAFPGGIRLRSFTESWGALNRLLDSGDVAGAVALNLRLSGRAVADLGPGFRWLRWAAHPAAQALVRTGVRAVSYGAAAVGGDRAGLAAAVREHAANEDIDEGARRVAFRDDPGLSVAVPEATVDDFSPHRGVDALRASGIPVLSVSGGLDGGYAGAAVKRHRALGHAGSRLILGPWNHGGADDASPYTEHGPAREDHAATLLAFFDHHLRGRSSDASPVSYYTLGEERWKSAATWPPPHVTSVRYHLAADGLVEGAPPPGQREYTVDPDVGTGHRARWDSLLGLKAPIGTADAAGLCRRALTFTSAPLARDLVITGSPRLTVSLRSSEPDGGVFAYLLDVSPSGAPTVLTEGMLRIAHRHPDGAPSYLRGASRPLDAGQVAELCIELLPVSAVVRTGHSLRLALTGADAHHFEAVGRAAMWTVLTGAAAVLELPVEGAAPQPGLAFSG